MGRRRRRISLYALAVASAASRRQLGLTVAPGCTRYRFRAAYDGTKFYGWQIQPKQRTVQGTIEKALTRRFDGFRVLTLGASRTDKGVHAQGQVVQADLPREVADAGLLEYQINRMLPEDVRIYDFEIAPQAHAWQVEQGLPWHAIINSKSKRYEYKMTVGKAHMDPMKRLYRARLTHQQVDFGLLEDSLKLFVGTHDFRTFGNGLKAADDAEDDSFLSLPNPNADCNPSDYGRSTVRTILGAEVIDEGDGDATIAFDLDGALYKMVRNIVGTAVAVASGKQSTDDIHRYLQGDLDRSKNPTKPAPAHGLVLRSVSYDDDDFDNSL